jgi:hypothetical protein
VSAPAEVVGKPVVSSTALRSINFFNGRLLTGDDLRREQATELARLQRLGKGVGEGVAFGLEVEEALATSTKTHPVVTVSAGLAFSRSGTALELPADVDVSLYRDVAPPGAEPGNLFADCQPYAPGTYTAGAGVYLLTVGPDREGEGLAPVSGLGNEPAPCNVALSVEAVTFRLIRLALAPSEVADKAKLRNRVAYQCFDADALAAAVADPFGPPVETYGLLDTLRTQTLTPDEVPLAIVGWSIDDGIQFVDEWSVRRRLTRRAAEGGWTAFVSDRRRAEGEAMFLQFQAQLLDVLEREPDTDVLDAAQEFALLPPAGLLPLADVGVRGFGYREFLADVPTRGPVHMAATEVRDLLRESFTYAPIDLSVEELVWLYLVRENVLPPPLGTPPPQAYVLFAAGHLRYRADARFELSYWNFGNYAQIG